jgi:DNA-binding IscR family transcriptional regulator
VHNGLFDPVSVVTVMEVIAARFKSGKSTGNRFIAEASSLPEVVVTSILGRLVDVGILHRVETEENAVTLARPPEQVTAEELIEVGFQLVDGASSSQNSPLVERLRSAQRSLASQTTLANLVSLSPATDG